MTTRRIGVLGLYHETNTYSARRASLQDFLDYELLRGAEIVDTHRGTRSVVGGFLDAAPGVAVPLVVAGAWPSGPATEDAVAALFDEVHAALSSSGPLDGLLVNLHGAMVADARPDLEAELIRVIRDLHGAVPVAAVLDFHGNPSADLAEQTDILIGYDTYPHIDQWERGAEAAHLLARALDEEPLRTSIAKVPLLTPLLAQGTDDAPMSELLAWAKQRGADEDMERVSLQAGFPYSDVHRAGFSVLVVSTAARSARAKRLADEIAARVEQSAAAGAFDMSLPTPEQAVHAALSTTRTPVVLADMGDNIGGGSSGDGTILLAELLRQGATDAVVVLADAAVAREAARLGPGAAIRTTVGGKTDRLHGDPVEIAGTVVRVTDGTYTTSGSWNTGQSFSMGTTAVLDVDEQITLVVTERATPPFHPEHLTSAGVDPARARILVAKGAVAWKAAYGDVAKTVIEVDTPGACPADPHRLPRTAAPRRF